MRAQQAIPKTKRTGAVFPDIVTRTLASIGKSGIVDVCNVASRHSQRYISKMTNQRNYTYEGCLFARCRTHLCEPRIQHAISPNFHLQKLQWYLNRVAAGKRQFGQIRVCLAGSLKSSARSDLKCNLAKPPLLEAATHPASTRTDIAPTFQGNMCSFPHLK